MPCIIELRGGTLYYHYRSPYGIRMDEPLYTERCQAISKHGKRCKKNTIIGLPYCWIHQKYHEHLQIKPSTIPNSGKGVFVIDRHQPEGSIVFRSGDTICSYLGEKLTKQQTRERYGLNNSPYSLYLNRQWDIDASLMRGIGAMINHRPNGANCKFSINHRTDTATIKATRNIRNGEELYLNYGRDYRMNEAGLNYATNHKKYSF